MIFQPIIRCPFKLHLLFPEPRTSIRCVTFVRDASVPTHLTDMWSSAEKSPPDYRKRIQTNSESIYTHSQSIYSISLNDEKKIWQIEVVDSLSMTDTSSVEQKTHSV